jgi:hypothetical protein
MVVRIAGALACLLVVAGCGAASSTTPTVAAPATTAPAPVGTPIGFGFLTSAARYTAVIPPGLPLDFSDYGVVTSPAANQSIQYEPSASFDLDLKEIRKMPAVEGSAGARLFETKTRPVMPVLVWTLHSGKMWVVVRDTSEIDLIAAKMIVSEDDAGIPHVELVEPLTGGDPADPSQREEHMLYRASCEFINAGEFAADAVYDAGGVHMVTVATPFGIAVRCSSDTGESDAVRERAEAIAASITLDE